MCVCVGGGGVRARARALGSLPHGVLALSVIVAFMIILSYRLNLGFCGYLIVHN